MAYHGVLIPEAIAAKDIDSLNRSVYSSSASSIDNGMVFGLSGKVSTSGSGAEVWTIVTPATGSLVNIWMAYNGEEIPMTDGKYKGLDPNPRNAYNSIGQVFSAFKVKKGDIILLTAEAMTGTAAQAFANVVDGSMQLTWSAAAAADTVCFKYLRTTYISLADGSIGNQRVTAYELECISD